MTTTPGGDHRHYLEHLRHVPEIRQRFWRAFALYMLRRLLWSFGFFPVMVAFWVPFVLSNFNPVALAADIIPILENFVSANPEVQANILDTLVIAWGSVGFFFLVFDLILTPFQSPYRYEQDVYTRSLEQLDRTLKEERE